MYNIPEGWQLVPIEPTEEMSKVITWDYNRFYTPEEIWKDMLAASPRGTGAEMTNDTTPREVGSHEGLGDGARCWCHTCRPVSMTPPEDMRMVLCPDCGNKRCPKATNHMNACSGISDAERYHGITATKGDSHE